MREESGFCLEIPKGEQAGRGLGLGAAASLVAAVSLEAVERMTDLAADIFAGEDFGGFCVLGGVLGFQDFRGFCVFGLGFGGFCI